MKIFTALGIITAGLCLGVAGQARAQHCQIQPILELPITMVGSRPVMTGKVNGAEAQFMVDSGAYYSLMSRAAAKQYQLHLVMAREGFYLEGVGGPVQAWVATVKQFSLGGQVAPNIEFMVGGNDFGNGLAGVLGQNILTANADTDYDLATGIVRLIRPHDCSTTDLAYWAGSKPHSAISIEVTNQEHPHTRGDAYLNGQAIKVTFDTGASVSTLSKEAAARLGVTPDSPGVVEGGTALGIGAHPVRTWIAPFPSFKIGAEEVRNARLRFSDTELPDCDMLLGADFFLSHHIYVASSQRKLYFTYNGGPVFKPYDAALAASAPVPPAAAGDAQPKPEPGELADADGYARRGAASSARHDYVHALADLTRACELAPKEATYLYERAMLYLQVSQPVPARADLDLALDIKPDYLQALMLRSDLRYRAGDKTGAAADIDAAEHLAPKESANRMQIAYMYGNLGRMPEAVAQWDLWIASHTQDAGLPEALSERCWTKAVALRDLDHALADCNRALRLRPDFAPFLEARALLKFRRGEYRESLADYDSAQKLDSKPHGNAVWTHYVRGLDLLKLGRAAEGQAEIDAATKLRPKVVEDLGKYGIGP